jgi:hypothetical protein
MMAARDPPMLQTLMLEKFESAIQMAKIAAPAISASTSQRVRRP